VNSLNVATKAMTPLPSKIVFRHLRNRLHCSGLATFAIGGAKDQPTIECFTVVDDNWAAVGIAVAFVDHSKYKWVAVIAGDTD